MTLFYRNTLIKGRTFFFICNMRWIAELLIVFIECISTHIVLIEHLWADWRETGRGWPMRIPYSWSVTLVKPCDHERLLLWFNCQSFFIRLLNRGKNALTGATLGQRSTRGTLCLSLPHISRILRASFKWVLIYVVSLLWAMLWTSILRFINYRVFSSVLVNLNVLADVLADNAIFCTRPYGELITNPSLMNGLSALF